MELSFHDAASEQVALPLRSHGHEIERSAAAHKDMFASLGRSRSPRGGTAVGGARGHIAPGIGDYACEALGRPADGEVIGTAREQGRAAGREIATPRDVREMREMLGMRGRLCDAAPGLLRHDTARV